jgi:uncharacterized protein
MISIPDIRQYLKVEISSDGFEAVLRGSLPQEIEICNEDIYRFIDQYGVKAGLQNFSVEEIREKLNENGFLSIAKGTIPIAGSDGFIEYFFDSEHVRQEVAQNQKVDYHSITFVRNIKAGEKLVFIHAPGEGINGIKVTGDVVEPRKGKKAEIITAGNTLLSPDDSSIIIARCDGNIVLHPNKSIEVQPEITIRGNVDFSVGNIDFVGSLIVMGDVKSDFSIKTQKNIEIFGSVEDAQIHALGNIVIKKGFLGSGKGVVIAKGNVSLNTVLNQTVMSDTDVIITKEAVGGTIRAGGKILAQSATIVGGILDSDHEITVGYLGNPDGSPAHVRVGRKGKILERLGQIDREIKQTEKQLIEVKDAVYRMIRKKIDVGCLGEDCEQRLQKLQEVQKMIPDRLQQLQEEKNILSIELQNHFDGRVIVRGTVYENIHIEINGAKKLVETPLRGVIFIEKDGTIETRSI